MTPTTAPARTNSEMIRGVIDCLNRHDSASAKEYWSSEIEHRFPDRTVHGPDAVAAWFEESWASMADWHMEVITVAEQGDEVFVRWRLTGHHTGMLSGVAPTGTLLTLEGMDHMVVRDGKLISNFVVSDQLAPARQMGMMPPQDSLPERLMKRGFNVWTKLRGKRPAASPVRPQ